MLVLWGRAGWEAGERKLLVGRGCWWYALPQQPRAIGYCTSHHNIFSSESPRTRGQVRGSKCSTKGMPNALGGTPFCPLEAEPSFFWLRSARPGCRARKGVGGDASKRGAGPLDTAHWHPVPRHIRCWGVITRSTHP